MNPLWRSFLESADGRFDAAGLEVLDFGDAAAERQAAADKTVLAPLCHLGLIEVSGEDAKAFLHNQVTSDINHLGEGAAQHSSWCSAKGRMQASFLAWRRGDAYCLSLAADLQEAIQKRLQMFVLRSKVKLLSRSDDTILLGISGPQAGEALAEAGLPCPADVLAVEYGAEAAVIRLDPTRFIVVAPETGKAGLWQKLSNKARPVGVPAWRWLDIRHAFPLVTLATREEFVPQMADFEKIGGVSFHKGCYPGQEIVARTQYLGKVKRHLFRVSAASALAPGDVLHSPDNPDQSVGMIMSAAPSPAGGFEALAVIQSNYAGNVRVGAIDGPAVQAVAVNP